jgi:hypothetical protein
MKMEQRNVTVIPAQPGWFVLTPCISDADYAAETPDARVVGIGDYRTPIVAWQVDTYLVRSERDPEGSWLNQTQPVVLDILSGDYAVLDPSGRISFLYGECCDTQEEAVKIFQEHQADKIASRKETLAAQ